MLTMLIDFLCRLLLAVEVIGLVAGVAALIVGVEVLKYRDEQSRRQQND